MKYRCSDGFCGAEDCDHCYPQATDWEEREVKAELRRELQEEAEYLESLND